MTLRIAGVGLAALLLTACGSKEQPPIEQIVVRGPGQAAPAAAPAAAPMAAPTDLVAQGKAAFAACAACHLVEAGAASGVGPNLYGVVGREAASVDGFAYSEALKGSSITWSESELDAFLANPAAKVPGTSMAAGAVSDSATRKAIIAYLASLTG